MSEKIPNQLLEIIEDSEGVTTEFKEDDIFRTIIPIDNLTKDFLKVTGDKPAINRRQE